MRDLLPRSRFLSGFIIAIEGLAIWVIAIFLASYRATGWITWPGADMHTTAVGSMRIWLTSGPAEPFEFVAYLGLAVAVTGLAWFWVTRPALDVIERRRTARGRAERGSASGGADIQWEDEDWIPAVEATADSPSNDEDEGSEWIFSTSEPGSSRPDSIQAALANGDFLRGSGGESGDRNARES